MTDSIVGVAFDPELNKHTYTVKAEDGSTYSFEIAADPVQVMQMFGLDMGEECHG